MDMDPKVLEMIIKTFQTELDELLQVITDGLLQLEKHDYSETVIKSIFRAAHTIKGGSGSIGVTNVSNIAHHIESIFSLIQKSEIQINSELIDLCLQAVDSMKLSMLAFTDKQPLSIDINSLIDQLKKYEKNYASTNTRPVPGNNKKHIQHENNNHEYESIRVALKNLDRISDLMERIQVNKISVDDNYMELSRIAAKSAQFSSLWNKKTAGTERKFDKFIYSDTDFFNEMVNSIHHLQMKMHPHVNELETLFNALQDEVRTLRLIPAGSLLQTFPRLVRDLARDLNKSVELEITGNDVKIDKNILEGLKDPLIHLLRNAIDHGIENSDIRTESGKPVAGRIHIQIKDEGNHILFMIEDDGAGIDYLKIAETAAAKNILSKSALENMDTNNILQLIFLPGFSTKSTVGDISGRGVGLDIVKSNVNALKGSVSVISQPGTNTVFFLRVPLTLSSERGLIVTSGGEAFILPTTNIERVMILNHDDILEIEATQAIMLDEHPVPLRILSDILGLNPVEPANPDQLSIVVIKNDLNKIALLVDEIMNEKEIVIKSLQAPLKNMFGVSGGTLSADGRVILVINVKDLITTSLHPAQINHVQVHAKNEIQYQTKPHILVVDDSITTRTLEKNILESKKYAVTVAVNGKDAWDLLQKNQFSLMITDISMPIMDGFTLTERIRQSNELHDLPVIIVTSLGSDAEKKRGMEVGANAYIVKNEFESGALLELVSQLV